MLVYARREFAAVICQGLNVAEPQFDRLKFKDVVHYVCAACDPGHLGSVKLHKVLYYFDMTKYALTGTAATGATYMKQPRGPMARQMQPVLRDLQSEGRLAVSQEDYFGYSKTVYSALGEPEVARLADYERRLLDEIIDFVCRDNTAKTISEFSHNLAWESVETGRSIPYRMAFLILPIDPSDEAVDWAISEAQRIEDRPQAILDGARLRAFREGLRAVH